MTDSECSLQPEPHGLGQLGKYRLLERIGRGAMGDVYRAEHVLIERKVAIKVMRRELTQHPELVERFFCEARAVNLIAHPHVLEINDFAREADGTVWSVMELLEGQDLATVMRSEPIPLLRALTLARQLCAALAATHAAGILHRDVKPENVFVLQRNGEDFVKLIDFGIAQLPEPGSRRPAEPALVMGSPPYMAPEQARGLLTDERSDVYAVGAVLYELVTGRPLFEQATLEALLVDVVSANAPLASSVAQLPASVAPALDGVLARCLAKDKAARPKSALALDAELAAIAAQLTDGHPEPRAAQASSAPLAIVKAGGASRERERMRWPMRAACGVAALLGATASTLLSQPAPGEPLVPVVASSRAQAQGESQIRLRFDPSPTFTTTIATPTHTPEPTPAPTPAPPPTPTPAPTPAPAPAHALTQSPVRAPVLKRAPEPSATREPILARASASERNALRSALDPHKLLDPFHVE